MADMQRSVRDEALLSKLDRAMDSILAANAEIPFKPKLHPRYGVARLIAWFTSLLGWAIVFAGLAGVALALGIGSVPDLASLVAWINVPTAAAGSLGGLVLVNFAALTRASVDGADYQRQLLQLELARSVKGFARPRPPARPPVPPATEMVEPRVE